MCDLGDETPRVNQVRRIVSQRPQRRDDMSAHPQHPSVPITQSVRTLGIAFTRAVPVSVGGWNRVLQVHAHVIIFTVARRRHTRNVMPNPTMMRMMVRDRSSLGSFVEGDDHDLGEDEVGCDALLTTWSSAFCPPAIFGFWSAFVGRSFPRLSPCLQSRVATTRRDCGSATETG